ncbi:hypothetical protein HW445_29195, partial [Streptomyces sp. UH6]|nr:hypothetical protein [Streptomyces sp. UH6]
MGDLPPVLDARRDETDGPAATPRRRVAAPPATPPGVPSRTPPGNPSRTRPQPWTPRAQERPAPPDRLPTDADGACPPNGEPLLGEDVTAHDVTAQFVPAEEGGRLVRPDVLATVLRPLFR